jgi:hypothetical protein
VGAADVLGEGGFDPYMTESFGDFLNKYRGGYSGSRDDVNVPAMGYTPMGRAEMIARGREAGRMGQFTPMDIAGRIGTTRGAESLAGYYSYGAGPEASQNQLAAATAIAQSGEGSPFGYTPLMNRAIGGAMQDVYAARQAMGNPETDFLSWYINAISPKSNV